MFETNRRVGLFDYFRIPYEDTATEPADIPFARASGGRALYWEPAAAAGTPIGAFSVAEIPIFGVVASQTDQQRRLVRLGGTWVPHAEIRDSQGTVVGWIWRRSDGSFYVPFAPDDVVNAYLSEGYKAVRRRFGRLDPFARRAYYAVRPFVPRAAQMGFRRIFRKVQARSRFPRWPVETSLHDLYDLLLRLVADIADEPVPTLAMWPGDHRWALVLTHDVETGAGYANVPRLLETEMRRGYRSSWNFVPRRGYAVDDAFVEELRTSGFEVGVHGLLHDGRDVASQRTLAARLPEMRRYAERWGAVGFRSPSTIRVWELMPRLGFEYDSSYSDTAPFEPQSGGSCTWLPFMNGDLVELPITLTQDHTVFDLLGRTDAALWLEKAHFLRRQGGMALIITHPDYIGSVGLLDAYEALLEEFRDDETAWCALPAEVSAWWRRRAATTIERVGATWQASGPGRRDARIEFIAPAGREADELIEVGAPTPARI